MKMKKFLKDWAGKMRWVPVFSIFLIPPPGWAGPGTTTADFLNISPDAETAALGNILAAGSRGAGAALNNPAALNLSGFPVETFLGTVMWAQGVRINKLAVSFTGRRNADRRFSLALAGQLLEVSPFDSFDEFGNRTGTLSYKTYAAGVSGAWEVAGGLHLGMTFKVLSQSFNENTGATQDFSAEAKGTAWDAGIVWPYLFKNISIAASVQNIGSGVRFIDEREELPLSFRTGMIFELPDNGMKILAEVIKKRDEQMVLQMGMAHSIFNVLTLRAGYIGWLKNQNAYDFTFGFGLALNGIRLSYAFVPLSNLELSGQFFSMTIGFGYFEGSKAAY